MILVAVFLLFSAIAFCLSGLLTFALSLLRSMGVEVQVEGPMALVPASKMVLLGWGQVAVAGGLLLAALQVYIADGKREIDDPSK